MPIFAQLNNRPVLLVGAGHVALRKAGTLLKAGARLTVVATYFADEFIEWQQQGKATLIESRFAARTYRRPCIGSRQRLMTMRLTSRYLKPLTRAIFWSILWMISPTAVLFSLPLLTVARFSIAISSAGTAPVLARRLREKLEAILPAHLGPLAQLVGCFS